MARYNTISTTSTASGATTLTSPNIGLTTTITGTAPFTVTLPNPVLYTGTSQSFYNNSTGTVTLTTPSGVINGPGAAGTANLSMPQYAVFVLTSDGTNYILVSNLGGAITGSSISTVSLTASGAVTLTQGNSSTSATTGQTLIVTGGIGASGNIYNTGNINTTGTLFVSLGTTLGSTVGISGITTITSNQASTSTSTGALVVTGGFGLGGSEYIAGNSDIAGTLTVGQASTGKGQATIFSPVSTVLGDLATSVLNLAGSGSAIGNYAQIGFGDYATSITYAPAVIGFQTKSITGANYGDLVFATRNVTTDTAPSERLRIDSAGNIKKLVSSGTGIETNAYQLWDGGTNLLGSIRSYNAGGYNQYMRFYTANGTSGSTEALALTIDSNGNIWTKGQTSPTISYNSTTYTALASFNSGSTTVGALYLQGGGGTNTPFIKVDYNGSNQIMVLDDNGNLIIGPSSFTQRVSGASAGLYVSTQIAVGTASPNNIIHAYKSSGSVALTLQTGTAYGYFYNDGTNIGLASDVGTNGQKLIINRSASDNSLYIASNGQVIVGTTTQSFGGCVEPSIVLGDNSNYPTTSALYIGGTKSGGTPYGGVTTPLIFGSNGLTIGADNNNIIRFVRYISATSSVTSNAIFDASGNFLLQSAGTWLGAYGRTGTQNGVMFWNNGTGNNFTLTEIASNQWGIGFNTTGLPSSGASTNVIQFNNNSALANGTVTFGGVTPSTAGAGSTINVLSYITNSNTYGASARGFGVINTSGSTAYGAVYVSATNPGFDWQFGKGALDASTDFGWCSNGGGSAVMRLTSVGNLTIAGALAKGSGSFTIEHPLPSLSETHNLVHSFIEGPNADLIYRGEVTLSAGRAEVDIDQAARMTDGTFVLLCRRVQCFTTNETDWTPVKGKVTGNILTIEAQDPESTATISWLVIGERQDKHMYDTKWTDDEGRVIVEPLKTHHDYKPEEDPWHDDFAGPPELKQTKAPLV